MSRFNLPIVILLESHIDYKARLFQRDVIKKLSEFGYNTWALELPEEDDLSELKRKVASTESHYSSSIQDAVNFINRGLAKVCPGKILSEDQLLSMPIADMADILRLFVSSQRFVELARIFAQVKPNRIMLETMKMLQSSYEIRGVDFDLSYDHLKSQQNCSVAHLIDSHRLTHRSNKIADNLLRLQNNGKMVVAQIGRLHFGYLAQYFAQHQMLDKVIFLDIYSYKMSLSLTQQELDFENKYAAKCIDLKLTSQTKVDTVISKLQQYYPMFGGDISLKITALGEACLELVKLKNKF